MATPYITIGCPTTGGGQVMSGNSIFLIEGIAIACVGDKATCPKHKTVATIISGDPHMQVMGKAAARVNDSLSCGCKLLPKQNLVVQENGGNSRGNTDSIENILRDVSNNHNIFDEQVQVVLDNSFSNFLSGLGYKLKVGGNLVEGILDNEGKTSRFITDSPEKVSEFELFFKDSIKYFSEFEDKE
ncbi:PAAR domain-containing protein [Acinetobacter guerrae]|uniref:PAAR domain-containing protein n=1 Tax=Acinetobacter guerrae TaxID=1843371 RepID=UPI002467BE08|nr:PAAR domain-containing protein [Acinetobacter guerrae]